MSKVKEYYLDREDELFNKKMDRLINNELTPEQEEALLGEVFTQAKRDEELRELALYREGIWIGMILNSGIILKANSANIFSISPSLKSPPSSISIQGF